ncbi:Hpt domain-containing protein [Anaerotignum faecicola]
MTVNEFYQKVDGDYTDAINRLQSDVLIRKFLKMLPGDNSMTLLAEAVEKSEAEQAFRAVHTLKGMALNLSLSALAEGLFRDDGAAARQGGASCGNRAVL